MQVFFSLLLIPVFQFFIALLTTIPTWLIWNWIAHGIFDLPPLSILQTLGLQLLLGFLVNRVNVSAEQ